MELFIEKPDINDFAHFLWLLIVLALIIPDILVFGKELFASKQTPKVVPKNFTKSEESRLID